MKIVDVNSGSAEFAPPDEAAPASGNKSGAELISDEAKHS